MADRGAFDPVDLGARAVDLLQNSACVREQPLPGFGGACAAPVAHKQILAKLHLEAPHLPADRRLRDTEEARCAAEAAQVDDGDEVFELLQIHEVGDGGSGRPGSQKTAVGSRSVGNGAVMPLRHIC